MSTSNFQTEEEFKEYLDELKIQYHYGCFRENNGNVCHMLGDWYTHQRMYFEAVKQYGMTCEKFKFPRSCYKYGIGLQIGQGEFKKDQEQALKYFEMACDMGEPEACFAAGSVLRQNHQDFSGALKYFEKFCGMKHHLSGNGCLLASNTYLKGNAKCSIPKDLKKAYEFAAAGCELGNARCCANLSVMYRNGDGVQKDVSLAEHYKAKTEELIGRAPSPSEKKEL